MKKASSFHKELFLRRLKIAALIIIPAGLIVAAGFLVYRWEGFRIVSVEVSGNIAVKSDEIISLSKNKAENSFFGRLLGSDHILAWESLSVEDISADIFRLDDISSVVNAEERKVNITVHEREESAIWCAVSSVEEDPKRCFWMDDEGNLFAIGPDAEGVLVRVVNDHTGRPLDIKNKALSEDEMNNFEKISSIFSDLNWIISDISLKDASSRELTAKVSTGQEMIFNLSIDPLFGIPVIKSLIESGEWPRVQYLDLRIDGKGFYKLN